MSEGACMKADATGAMPANFTVRVCSRDGRLLAEYELSAKDHNIHTLAAAEDRAIMSLADFYGEQLVIVVTEETLTKLRQVQLKALPANDEEA